MTTMQAKSLLAGVIAMGVLLPCCALTSKAELVQVRYFSPEHVTSERVKAPDGAAQEVRLGKVSAGSNLRERIAYRNSAYELAYYDDYRWTEKPETFVRRALSRALFEVHGFRRAMDRRAPTLTVEVIAFDEVHQGSARAARVEVAAILTDDEQVLFEKTSSVERPVVQSPGTIEGFVATMTQVIDATAEALARDVEAALASRRKTTTPSDEGNR